MYVRHNVCGSWGWGGWGGVERESVRERVCVYL